MSGVTLSELAARPRMPVVLARYDRLRADLLAALDAEIGDLRWARQDDGGAAGCPGADSPLPETRHPDSWLAQEPVPDEGWHAALAVLARVGGAHGFGTPFVVADRPGQHVAEVRDAWGGVLRLTSSAVALVAVQTGCHLPAEGAAPEPPAPPHPLPDLSR